MKKNKTASQRRIETPIRFFYPTSDNWCPNFIRNTVEVSVHVYYNPLLTGTIPHGLIRICVTGADDTGMERDERLPIEQYETRLKEIATWCEYRLPNPLTMEWLRGQGFQRW